MLVRAHGRDVMLPILLHPITISVLIAGVQGTAALLPALWRSAGSGCWCFSISYS